MLDVNLKEKVYLLKTEAVIVENYLHIHQLWKSSEDNFLEEEDRKLLMDTCKKLQDCIVCVYIDDDIYRSIKYLVDEEVEGVFFQSFCSEDVYNRLKSKVNLYKKINKP